MHAKSIEERVKKREQTLKAMAEAAKNIQQCKFEDDIQSESLLCLHNALAALNHLQDIMTVAANFWNEIHSVCNQLSEEKITKQVDRLLAIPEEKRQRLWNSKPFKLEAIQYYSNWVAIRKVCTDSRASITSTQHLVHLFIRQNPTKMAAVDILQTLADEFKSQVGQITNSSDQ